MFWKKEMERRCGSVRQVLAYYRNVSLENWEVLHLQISHYKLKDTINTKRANNHLTSISIFHMY